MGWAPPRTAEQGIAFVKTLLEPSVRVVRIVAQVDADDGGTWWDVRCVFAFPPARRPEWAEGMRGSIEKDELHIDRLVAMSPGHLVDWREPAFRGPATQLAEDIARAFETSAVVLS